MPRFTPQEFSLQDLIADVHSAKIKLPEFQRDFKWAGSDQRSLLDSIQKGYPVGTLLFLATNDATGTPFGERPFQDVPVQEQPDKTEYLVLDGQQRLSTCYRAFKAADTQSIFCIKLRDLFDRTGGKAHESIDLADLLVLRRRPVHLERLLYNSDLLPLTFLTDRGELRTRLSQYRQNLSKKPETEAFSTFVDIHLEGYVDVFFDYGFPTVVLPADLDLEAVANVFTKINTTGLKLSAFDLCVATLYPRGVRLRELLSSAQENDDLLHVDSDGTNILQTVALLADQPPKKAALPKNIKKQHIDDYWGPAVGGLIRAAGHLSDVGVTEFGAVPYDALVPPLAAALAGLPEPKSPPEREAIKLRVARWVYQTALAQRYNEGTDVKQAGDYKSARDWLGGAGSVPGFLEEQAVWQSASVRTIRSGARARAIIALLNESGPRDFILTAKHLGRGEGRQLSQLHHVFPRKYLEREGYKRQEADITLNLTFLSPESNNFISDRPPSEYVEELLVKRTAEGLDRTAALQDTRELFRGHLINDEAWDAMVSDDYDTFLSARAAEIQARVKNRFGVQIVMAEEESPEPVEDDDEAVLTD